MSILPSDSIPEAVPQISAEGYRLSDGLRPLWQEHQAGERADARFQVQLHGRLPLHLHTDAGVPIRLPHDICRSIDLCFALHRRMYCCLCIPDSSQFILQIMPYGCLYSFSL